MRLLFIATVLTLATPQPPSASQTFRSDAQIVEVDVRVLKDGSFVADLGPTDFEILEDGVPQKIVSVDLVEGAKGAKRAGGAEGAGAEGATRAGAEGARGAGPAQAVPAVWVFFFDTANLTAGPLQRLRDAVVTFIDKLPEGTIAGVISEGRLANNRFTSDRQEVLAAARAVRVAGDTRAKLLLQREWPRLQDIEEAMRFDRRDPETVQVVVNRGCAEDQDFCNRPNGRAAIESLASQKAREAVVQENARSLASLNAIEALGRGLSRVPGPKTVVFLSEGFVISGRESEVRFAVGRVGGAGARIYTVDARGLDRSGGVIIDQPVAFDRSGGQMGFDLQADSLTTLGVDTGGFAIRNENNFGRALDEIQRDAGTYYVVGYTPTNTTFDGKYRSIAVKVSRPGVKVRARRGYLAVNPAALLRPTSAASSERETDRNNPNSVTPAQPAAPADRSAAAAPKPAADETPARTGASTAPANDVMAALGKEPAARMSPATGSSAIADRGWAAYSQGDLESAVKDLGDAARAPDARPWVSYALGLAHFALQRPRDAAQAWERVRREVPEFQPVYFNLADAYTLQKEDGAALRTLREAEKRWPADDEVANAIGVIHVRRGSLDAAIDSFARATTVAPGEGLGYFNLARTLQMRLAKSQRYDPQMQKWVGGDEDRRRAVANFQKYLELGGPYERQAREALVSLSWK